MFFRCNLLWSRLANKMDRFTQNLPGNTLACLVWLFGLLIAASLSWILRLCCTRRLGDIPWLFFTRTCSSDELVDLWLQEFVHMAVKRPPHCTSCGLKSCWRWTIAFKKWVCNISCRGLCYNCRSKKISDASKKVSSSAKQKAGSLGGRRKNGKSRAGALGGQSQSRNKCLATRCNLAYGRLKRRWGSNQGKKVDLSFHAFLITV